MTNFVLDQAIDAARTFFEDPTITRKIIRYPSKEQYYTERKAFVMAFLRAYNPKHFSYPNIARIVGRKDHTTAIVGVRKAHALWGSHLFQRLAMRVVDPQQPPKTEQLSHRSVSYDELMRIGESILAIEVRGVFCNGSGWRAA